MNYLAEKIVLDMTYQQLKNIKYLLTNASISEILKLVKEEIYQNEYVPNEDQTSEDTTD